jgi:transcriptional regulator with XRE-family HTH domain
MRVPKRDRAQSALGSKVRQLRTAKGWTQEVLAERATLDRSYIAGIEAGLRNPSLKALVKVAKAFGVSLSTLVEDVK